MAMVYRAQDLLLNRAVALKILYPELSADPLFVERFRREAQAAANLSHPNIVPVFDWGEDEGTYFIVMELVEGTSLADMLRGSRTLTASRSAQLVAQVAAALGYAHRNGVVHRDVKPGNILIASDGQVKVTDFGIAQAVSSEDQLAEEGSVMGTATYFSPEQAEGAAVDGRSDVYSLGVVLYEMLVGRPPFIGDSPVAVSSQHVHGTVPPLTDFNNTVPHDLESIVMEALAKSPAQRYQTADEFRADLLRFTEGQPVRAAGHDVAFWGADATRSVAAVAAGERTQSVPVMTGPRTDVRRRRDSRTGIIAAVVIVLLAVGGLAYFLMSKTPPATTMPPVVGEQITNAKATLTGDGFTVKILQQSSTKPVGTVLTSNPAAGASTTKGQLIILRVSLGVVAAPVSVPDTTKMTLSDAENTLTTAQLKYTPNFVKSAPAGTIPDTVISQTPKGGTQAHVGDTVVLNILSPGYSFSMPDLSGNTTAQAGQTIGQDQLTVSPTPSSQCSNTVASGLVVATNPAANQPVKAGSAVILITSSGVCKVLVPNVIGRTTAGASATLKSDNLTLGNDTVSTSLACTATQSGFIDSQSPAPGLNAPFDSAVDVTTCP
jgi:beta-lactam-binding protein with PASTA domain/tRNA A-37 threonylcarbamoyl transferase component Bud32